MSIYLDHNASTPPLDAVVEEMLPWLRHRHANPHADHVMGRKAAEAVAAAKASVGALIGANGNDIFFTSGATEANNLVVQGLMGPPHLRTALVHSTVEHKSIAELGAFYKVERKEVRKLPVDRSGRVAPASLRSTLSEIESERVLVCLIHANNEIGTIQAIPELAAVVDEFGALLHLDATQSAAWVPIDVTSWSVQSLTLSAHKLGGPMGIGACYISRELRPQIRPLMRGGGQQEGIRPGTIPVFLAVGFGVACELSRRRRELDALKAEESANLFLSGLSERGVRFRVIGDPTSRIPGLRSVQFPNIDARDLLDRLTPALSASTGAACSAGELRASHVLRAIGLTEVEANQVARFGFGRGVQKAEVTAASRIVADAVESCVRALGGDGPT